VSPFPLKVKAATGATAVHIVEKRFGQRTILEHLGSAHFRTNGWDEWKAKWPAISNKATLKQQYDCHVAAGVCGLPFTKDYNLERFRPNRTNHWSFRVAKHRYNWTSADRY
jgi:hypothetical protein